MPALHRPAPDFSLHSANGTAYRLSDFDGVRVVLAFYRSDTSRTCQQQLAEYSSIYPALRARNVEMLGIGPDPTQSHFGTGCKLDLTFPLLSDERWDAARLYSVTSLVTGYGRATFVIDETGILRAAFRPSMGGLQAYTPAEDVLAAVDALPPVDAGATSAEQQPA